MGKLLFDCQELRQKVSVVVCQKRAYFRGIIRGYSGVVPQWRAAGRESVKVLGTYENGRVKHHLMALLHFSILNGFLKLRVICYLSFGNIPIRLRSRQSNILSVELLRHLVHTEKRIRVRVFAIKHVKAMITEGHADVAGCLLEDNFLAMPT